MDGWTERIVAQVGTQTDGQVYRHVRHVGVKYTVTSKQDNYSVLNIYHVFALHNDFVMICHYEAQEHLKKHFIQLTALMFR